MENAVQGLAESVNMNIRWLPVKKPLEGESNGLPVRWRLEGASNC